MRVGSYWESLSASCAFLSPSRACRLYGWQLRISLYSEIARSYFPRFLWLSARFRKLDISSISIEQPRGFVVCFDVVGWSDVAVSCVVTGDFRGLTGGGGGVIGACPKSVLGPADVFVLGGAAGGGSGLGVTGGCSTCTLLGTGLARLPRTCRFTK
jgi:hypothetical protein